MTAQALVEFGDGESANATVSIVVDELNPGVGVVGLARDVAEGQPEGLVRRGEKLCLSRNVVESSGFQEAPYLIQVIEIVQENVVMATATGGGLDQHFG
jgi:hypothetical protein